MRGFEFLTAGPNLPFSIALCVMFGLALLEGVTAVFGMALSEMIEMFLPDAPDIDSPLEFSSDGIDLDSPAALSRMLGWFHIGRVPVLMLLVVFLVAFGLIGLAAQSFVLGGLGFLLPGLVASAVAFVPSLYAVRIAGKGLSKIMPKDESEAVSIESLVGRVATITLGVARKGSPAEAKVRDAFGNTHYVRVEPDENSVELRKGEDVLLLRYNGSLFEAIKNPNKALVD